MVWHQIATVFGAFKSDLEPKPLLSIAQGKSNVNLHMVCINGSGKVRSGFWAQGTGWLPVMGKELAGSRNWQLVSASGLSKELFQGKELVSLGNWFSDRLFARCVSFVSVSRRNVSYTMLPGTGWLPVLVSSLDESQTTRSMNDRLVSYVVSYV